MVYLRLLCLLSLTLLPSLSRAQRGGRADSAQNYYHRSKPHDPTIAVRINNSWKYRKLSELRLLKRVTVEGKDAKSGAPLNYQGVHLDQLLPADHLLVSFRLYRETHWGFRDRIAISSADLDKDSEVILADTQNDRPITRANPFSVVLRQPDGALRVIRDVASVQLRCVP